MEVYRHMVNVFLILSVIVHVSCAPAEDRVTYMPGQPPGSEKIAHYAGYLHITKDISLFYWFFECVEDPHKAPVTVWVQGGYVTTESTQGGAVGSGSQSILMDNIGPWSFVTSDTLKLNENPWIKITNMLHLDYGPRTGYSYTNASDDEYLDDYIMANRSSLAIHRFFKKFPEFSRNHFYVAGESRGFTGATLLANLIIQDPNINFQGLYSLSAITTLFFSTNIFAPYLYFHGLVGKSSYMTFLEKCCNDDYTRCEFPYYDYVEICTHLALEIGALNKAFIYGKCALVKENVQGAPQKVASYCIPKESVLVTMATEYLNRDDVKNALHVNSRARPWTEYIIEKKLKDNGINLEPILKNLISKGKRVMLTYADGDVEAPIEFQIFVERLKIDAIGEYDPWYYLDEENTMRIGGFVQHYEKNVTFSSTMKAGHEQGRYNPLAVYSLFRKFLLYEDLWD